MPLHLSMEAVGAIEIYGQSIPTQKRILQCISWRRRRTLSKEVVATNPYKEYAVDLF